MSFAQLPEPFGVELRFAGEGLFVEASELPEGQGETKTARAVRAMQNHLEVHRGIVIDRQALLAVGIEQGNVRVRAAAALKELLERLGNAVVTVNLPGRRDKPVAYRLEDAELVAICRRYFDLQEHGLSPERQLTGVGQ